MYSRNFGIIEVNLSENDQAQMNFNACKYRHKCKITSRIFHAKFVFLLSRVII